MNEEIIIDCVDVSECKYRSDIRKVLLADGEIMTFKNYCQVCNDGCYAIDCYYKQLKRLQAENEQLKHKNENLKLALSSYELPEVVKVLTDWRTGELQLKENKLEQEKAKYRKALKEIRDDLEQDITCESRECGCDDYGECLKCIKETIIEICDEVLK